MDLYRFFHPHHNPRLRQKPLRLQEVSELELAAKELLRALKRASIRIESSKSSIPQDFIESAINATELSLDFLHSAVDVCNEDKDQDLADLMKERANAPGWEAWCALLSERLKSIAEKHSPIHLENPANYSDQPNLFEKINEHISNLSENPPPQEIIKIKASA